MKANIKNAHYLFHKDGMEFTEPVEIHVSRFGNNNKKGGPVRFDNPHAFRVYINTTEPVSSQNREEISHVISNANNYNLILTSDAEILNSVSHAVFFPYGTTWLNKDRSKIDHSDGLGEYTEDLKDLQKNKKFSVSFLGTSHKPGPDGYKMRHELWAKEHEISIPKIFYSSTRHPLPLPPGPMGASKLLPEDDKKHLFNSQFSIAIESTSVENYFSEKLIDCFITKTIPVYWGCPNIEEFFDTRGMIIVNSVDDIIKKVNKLTPKYYEKKKKYVEENFKLAQEYARSFTDRVQEVIMKELPTVEESVEESQDNFLLTIGIVTLKEREEKLLRLINAMKQHTTPENMECVELLINSDEGQKAVGHKRNEVLQKARGKFVCFVDDDDLVSDHYINMIVSLIRENPKLDCIGFMGLFYNDGKPHMTFKHANMYRGNYKDSEGIQYRPANHLNPVKTDIAKQIGFPENKNFGEDSDYSDLLLRSNLIQNEMIIDNEVMYHYLFSKAESKTHN